MKRDQPSKATSTALSSILNHRTQSYRLLEDTDTSVAAPVMHSLDPKVARTHYNELQQYLAVYLTKAPQNARLTARQKLTQLTEQQFQELSTDIYDELMRRKMNTPENEIPYLPARDEFQPKRNEVRQKLATLPITRFEDLSSDVYFELSRRYPEFKEERT